MSSDIEFYLPNKPGTGGYTVHGFKVNYDKQEAFLVITNGKNVQEITSIQTRKIWNDSNNHSGDSVIVYLLANGTRIREEVLNEANDWSFTWDNMPKYMPDGVTEVQYNVQEGTVPGYVGRVQQVTEFGGKRTVWETVSKFENGGIYLLQTGSGYLTAGSNKLSWTGTQSSAEGSGNARWIATVSGNNVKLINEAGQALVYSSNQFKAQTGTATNLTFNNGNLRSGTRNYMGNINNNGVASRTTSSSQALKFTLLKETVVDDRMPVEGIGFQITNTPVDETETVNLTVKKMWNTGTLATTAMYEQFNVTFKLLADGEETGMTTTVNLKNNWEASFVNLPKFAENGTDEIDYTVLEDWSAPGWRTDYGEKTTRNGNEDDQLITVTNVSTLVYMLPETGGVGTLPYTMEEK